MLEKIQSPTDIKGLSIEEINLLAKEIREEIINVASQNGGHLSSNLGMVEPTIVLHQAFDSPNDKFVFDVGHQAYAHKLITGRYKKFSSLRKFGGLSGFTNIDESDHDMFSSGHSGTALAQAIGIAEANKLDGNNDWTIVIIGDGSMTNGLFYEALNNCSEKDIRLLIILNDNEMSISHNVGGMSKHLSRIRTSSSYFKFKDTLKSVFEHIPLIGNGLIKIARAVKNFSKRILTKYNIFESLGIDYIGVVEGKDIKRLKSSIEYAKLKNSPSLIHIITKKGDGYSPAENEPDKFHSVGKFDVQTGEIKSSGQNFSKVFGEKIVDLAEKNEKLCAITAAMKDGTGLGDFAEKYPDRFFDVGIAEEYAVSFASGLSKKGYMPICAMYSTFSQRVYDELWQDISLQKLPMVLALDRSGIVPGDGKTHQGIFDYSLLSSIPNVNIYSPETYLELCDELDFATNHNGLSVIRYPKGSEVDYDRSKFVSNDAMSLYNWDEKLDVLFITYGRITSEAYSAVCKFGPKVKAGILKLKQIAPLDFDYIYSVAENAKLVYFLEEGVKSGSVSEKIAASFAERKFAGDIVINTLPNDFLPCGSVDELKDYFGLSSKKILG